MATVTTPKTAASATTTASRAAVVACLAAPAHAQWVITPQLGMNFAGEVEHLCRRERLKAGIDVEDPTWDKLRALAGEDGLAAELGLN